MKNKFMLCLGCALLLLSITLIADNRKAQACSCPAPRSMDEIMQSEDEVFAGTVVEITKPRGKFQSSADPLTIRMNVTRVWKGIVPAEAVIETAQSSASCGYDGFKEGGAYLVVAEETPNGLHTGLCFGNKPMGSVGQELAYLGDGYAPSLAEADPAVTKKSTQNLSNENSGYSLFAMLAAAVVLAAVCWAAVIMRRRKY
ncbi:hypothetical protein DNH61_16510 [Paenibacillus sambharensis]|uniref:Tissue inhibitor of metalloproteinase n=1 Tax=Paenibacillus sambharensis TaxID=1803190 RepID=A0A2W1L6X5_9BACL|nr:hypothetical protein [Paenibacillus sambharensis]PZD94569.1 hypothetical protein DNH61_16510 [Paenibacillus sambharensis]